MTLPLLALVLAQSIVIGNPDGPIISQPSLMNRYAFFEFAPTSGAGMGLVAPYPNWMTYSEQFDNAAWTKESGGAGAPALPTITADYAANPVNGAQTAERVQLPATATTGYSDFYRTFTITTTDGTVATCSVYVQSNGASGSTDLCSYTGAAWTCATCSYSSSWSRCSTTAAAGTGTVRYCGFGNNFQGHGGTYSAADLNVFGMMGNAGSTAAPYVATTTAAMGYAPTGAKGEVLTFTRASTAMATATAGGGLATTGIANGDLRLMPSNQPRTEYDSNGILALRVESSARTNYCVRSQELGNASWLATGLGVAAAVVTDNQATAPDGTATAERVQIAACPSAGNYSLVLQTIGAIPSPTGSIYVKGNGGAGSFTLYVRDGAVAATAVCSYVAASWSRCSVPLTTAGATQFGFGCINTVAPVGGTNTGAADFFAWGADLETGAFASSYIPTVAAAVTRAAESASFVRTFFSTSGGASLAVTAQEPSAAPVFARYFVAGDSSSRLQVDANTLTNYIGRYNVAFAGPTPSGAGTTRAGAALQRVAVAWDGTSVGTLYAPGGGVYTDTSAKGAWTGGTIDFLTAGDGIVSRVCADPSPTRCR